MNIQDNLVCFLVFFFILRLLIFIPSHGSVTLQTLVDSPGRQFISNNTNTL
jgi:hypothetical protein